MPELPEVETVARDLAPHLAGRTVLRADVRMPSIVRYPDAAAFEALIAGRQIESVGRRGKYIVHELGGGDLLLVHLGMSGQWRLAAASDPEPDHLHAVLELDGGRQLRYRDPRRFGRLLLGSKERLIAAGRLPRLGPEPVDPAFTAADLRRRLAGRRAAIKAVLLDQTVVAGVGNIYADESLFRAGVRPGRPAGRVGRVAAVRLREALTAVLTEAIANRGSSVDSYLDAWGERGRQQERLRVYGRAGEPCLKCGRPLSRAVLAGRTTVFCRRCQR